MGQTRTEKQLARALEALKYIRDHTVAGIGHDMSEKVYAELTEPQYEEVEVKRWECKACGDIYTSQPHTSTCVICCGTQGFIELTGSYDCPVKEKSWGGVVTCRFDAHGKEYAQVEVPLELRGKHVHIEPLIEEGE